MKHGPLEWVMTGGIVFSIEFVFIDGRFVDKFRTSCSGKDQLFARLYCNAGGFISGG